MLVKVLVFAWLFVGVSAAFSCPKDKITIAAGKTGVIPSGATDKVKFAAGTQCTFTFTIPKGYAIRMESSANYEVSPGDFVKFDYFFIMDGADKDVEYAMGPELNVSLMSVTGNLNFFAKYSYLDLSRFSQVVKKTGDYFNTTLEPMKYYTVQATAGDTVTWNLAMRDTGFYDHSIYELMMFDGPDITNSEYIGRVTEYSRSFDIHSETNTLTFLNLYGSASDSFIMANDYSKIQPLPQYNAWVVAPNADTSGWMYNVHLKDDAYYTFICDGCTHFYIDQMYFTNESYTDGFVEVQSMSPTQGLPVVLKYTDSVNTGNSLPQLILSPMATFHTHRATIKFNFKPDLQTNRIVDRSEQKAMPMLDNPKQSFSDKFSDSEKVNKFVNTDSVQLV